MATVANPAPPVAPVVISAVLLLAARQFHQVGLSAPTGAQILEVTGTSRSRAYEVLARLEALLPTLVGPVGRPHAPTSPEPEPSIVVTLMQSVIDFILARPGCIRNGPQRQGYSLAFRHFILRLRDQHAALELEQFARAVQVPLSTLSEWLKAAPSSATDADVEQANFNTTTLSPLTAELETILHEYQHWSGTFRDFCRHLREHCGIPYGLTFISNVLAACGRRRPKRREGRSPDELATRGSFVTFFPNAQWVGDGSPIQVCWGPAHFEFNLELMVDCCSGAFVGLAVSDAEDSKVVERAFLDACATTSQQPLAVLLDNRSSNHTNEIRTAIGDTICIRATPGRGQNKAHVEGAFGLFQQQLPPITLPEGEPRLVARRVFELVAQAFFRGLNHRPRRDRNGRSRVDLHQDHQPTPDQFAQARAALEERRRKQELAQQTRAARRLPHVRCFLDELFQRLSLDDPEEHARLAIARYPFSAIVDGAAILAAKLERGEHPDDPARYLLGIVRNIAQDDELILTAERLIDARTAAQDTMLASLARQRDAELDATADRSQLALDFVERALASKQKLTRLFWLQAAVEASAMLPRDARADQLHIAALLIQASRQLDQRDRLEALRILAGRLLPLD